jgi:hypothetical protein
MKHANEERMAEMRVPERHAPINVEENMDGFLSSEGDAYPQAGRRNIP